MRLGSDPEVFLQQNGKFKAVCGMLGGHDKWNPFQVPDMPAGFTFQEDNVAVEFGIPPATSAQEFKEHIKAVQQRFLADHKHLTFSQVSAVVFPDEEMLHPSAHIFGCEPDFNAWTGRINKKPKPPAPNLRSAGGHIHIETSLNPNRVVQACDRILGVASVLMDEGELRKKLYGKAGACRYKPYGPEYRVLSNFWIFTPELVEWAWNGVAKALALVESGWKPTKEERHAIVTCINDSDKALAKSLVKEYSLELV
jgi:Phage phiEco32-like COOH.NH2 ligase-type 2